MGIPPTRFRQYPHEFSGGMRQRIMIALALVLRPKFAGRRRADDVARRARRGRRSSALLADLKRNFGTALLLITHNLGIVAEACDRMAVMYAGQIVEEGPVREVFADPAHPYTRELLRSTISLDTTELHSIPGAPPNLIDPPTGCRFHPAVPERDAGVRRAARRAAARRAARPLLAARPEQRIPSGGATLDASAIGVADEA